MSDLSLLSGVYANVEAYGALIDKVIERLGRGEADPADPDQKRLAQLFVEAGDQGLASQSLEALMFDSLLTTGDGQPVADLKRLGEQLLNGDVAPACLTQLETLAQGLEQERADVARRLRGR